MGPREVSLTRIAARRINGAVSTSKTRAIGHSTLPFQARYPEVAGGNDEPNGRKRTASLRTKRWLSPAFISASMSLPHRAGDWAPQSLATVPARLRETRGTGFSVTRVAFP